MNNMGTLMKIKILITLTLTLISCGKDKEIVYLQAQDSRLCKDVQICNQWCNNTFICPNCVGVSEWADIQRCNACFADRDECLNSLYSAVLGKNKSNKSGRMPASNKMIKK